MASTETLTYQDNLNSQYLSNSLSSLSSARSTNSLIVRSYKQATQLYLTRRFKEALEVLEPIVTPQTPAENGTGNGNGNGEANGDANGASHSAAAPVAQSARGTRTKVWVFYLSLLNSIVELGQEEGKLVFGAKKWAAIANKVRNGSVWDEIVSRGYGDSEGDVDADVVVNLATLLLGHMQDQQLSQQRLETYLSASDGGGHLSFVQDGMSTPMSNSSSSPRSLATRLKILELYTLHVLPANGEWEYSRQFISINDMMDEERREAFLNALQNLKEEKDGTAQRERELAEQRDREMEAQQRREKEEEEERKEEEARQAAAAAAAATARKEEERRKSAAEAAFEKPKPSSSATTSSHRPIPSNGSINSNAAKPTRSTRPPHKPQKKPPSPPPTLYRRASSLLANLHHMLLTAGQNMSSMAALRFVMFMLAFLLIVARRDLRLRIRRAVEGGWGRFKQTVAMGTKVSYI